MWVSKTAVMRALQNEVTELGDDHVRQLLAEDHALSSYTRAWLVRRGMVANAAELETLLRAVLTRA